MLNIGRWSWRSFALALAIPTMPVDAAAPAPPAADMRWLDHLVEEQAALGSDAWRAAKLAGSPRSHRMVRIRGAGRMLAGFVVLPIRPEKAPVLLMIPEDQGLNDWARGMGDELAAMGYVVIVPDMLSGLGPNGGDRDSFPDLRSIFLAHSMLVKDSEPLLTAELDAWADYASTLPRGNGRLAVVGFGWGGGRGLFFAAQRADLSAAFVFYDAAPPELVLAGLRAPLYGFYAANDPRVTRSLPGTAAAMTRLGRTYEAVTYPGSDHMFVRLGEEPRDPNPGNIAARHQSLARLQELLARTLR